MENKFQSRDPNKQAQEVIFSCKIQKSAQHPLICSNNIVTQSITQKHSGMFFRNVSKLDIQEHPKSIFSKFNKRIGLLQKPHHILPRSPLLTTYKSFIRPHLDYMFLNITSQYYSYFCGYIQHKKY